MYHVRLKKVRSPNDNASVSDNTASHGGGVYVANTSGNTTAPFTMNGNTSISGNEASKDGGGMYHTSGTFYLKGGVIYGNTADNNSNTTISGSGAAFYRAGGYAYYQFIKDGLLMTSSFITRDNTINIVNGVLQ